MRGCDEDPCRILHRPGAPPTPVALVRLGARNLSNPALALTGRRCVPARLMAADFSFTYPALDEALEDLLSERS